MLILIPSVFASSPLMLELSEDSVIMPQGNQTLSLSLSKPTFGDYAEIEIRLEINGSAKFENNQSILIFKDIEWNGSIIKKFEKEIPIIINKVNDKNSDIISIHSKATYYRTLFGYRKTKETISEKSISFSGIWTISDEQLYGNLEELQSKHITLEEDYQKANEELVVLRNEKQQLSEELETIKEKSKKIKYYKTSTFILIIISILLAYMHFHRHIKKKPF